MSATGNTWAGGGKGGILFLKAMAVKKSVYFVIRKRILSVTRRESGGMTEKISRSVLYTFCGLVFS